MATRITRDIVEAHLNCKFKAYLRLDKQTGKRSSYETMLIKRRDDVRLKALDKLVAQQPMEEVERAVDLTPAVLKRASAFIFDAVADDGCFQLRFDGLKRIDEPSELGKFYFVPLLFHESRQLGKRQKLLLALYAIVLSSLQGKTPEFGFVWHGPECQVNKVLLKAHLPHAERLIESLRQMQVEMTEPQLFLNDHCSVCEFRQQCHARASKDDNLSLLRGLAPKEISKYARKGIFTVTQLSHTFRPRRKGKRSVRENQKRHQALQAMAIRDKTIYVLGAPQIRTAPVQIYFDIEALPDEGFVYLIGMNIVEGGVQRQFSFWGDRKEDERAILERFLAALPQHDDFVLYSYGSYETAFLKRMKSHLDLAAPVERALKASVNVLAIVYAHVYFPTFSNGLKEIGASLGCAWSDPSSSGLQSIVWRTAWESVREDQWKQKLLRYNLEDCTALKVVADQLSALAEGTDSGVPMPQLSVGPLRSASVHEIDKQARVRQWGAVNFVHSDYEYINGCAYFNYQRQKVYVQTKKSLRRTQSQPPGFRSRRLKVTRHVDILAAECERCQSVDLDTIAGRGSGRHAPRRKRAFDLVESSGGVKLSVIECRSKLHRCRTCGTVFIPKKYLRLARYFHGVKSWAMYQHVAHALSFGTINEMLNVFFGLPMPKAELHRFKAEMACYYEPNYRRLWDNLMAGPLLHVDETQIRLKGGPTAYVWAFTNLEDVVYMYRPNREGAFLRELLKDFRGVLVSDFYAAYDSIACPQQKCLVHLIRDMNDDLVASPFDNDLQLLTKSFGVLVRPIVASIGEHGLRKWYLKRFKRSVAEYFRLVESMSLRSDVALALRERLLKYQTRLFTFLDYDDVPWNNNNAENAIKRFAMYRAHASGMMKESGVTSFLTLLSVCQTCKYKGINFWRFLSSREQHIDEFNPRKRIRKALALDIYPDGYLSSGERFPKGAKSQPVAEVADARSTT